MAALKLDMTIPLADTGHITLTIDIASITTLTADDRAFLADTVAEFCTFASRTLAPPERAITMPAAIHDPSADVLRGVTGSRIRTDL